MMQSAVPTTLTMVLSITTDDVSNEEAVKKIREQLAPEISELGFYFLKCNQEKKFFGKVENLVPKCKGNALADAIWFYLSTVEGVTCIICDAECSTTQKGQACPKGCEEIIQKIRFVRA